MVAFPLCMFQLCGPDGLVENYFGKMLEDSARFVSPQDPKAYLSAVLRSRNVLKGICQRRQKKVQKCT